MKQKYTRKYNKLVRLIQKYIPSDGQLVLLKKAYWFGFEAHKGQYRRSGDPFFEHCVATANILAELSLDVTTIVAGLLHDVVEDTGITIDEVRQEFGDDIAMLVDGVTKIADLRFKDAESQQAENFRKMLLSMARDLRVIMIKFADRLHNMRTLEHLPDRKQKWIAQETLDVYAPLALRFGIAKLAWQLEDLALKFIEPDTFYYLEKKIAEKWSVRMEQLERMKEPIRKEMIKLNVPCSIMGKVKSYYGVFKKMQRQNITFEDVYDIMALRIVTEKKEDCYAAVGVVHTLFVPVADRFKDYIATPKRNGYQSIHTTVINPDGKMMELQIRTKAMDYSAEFGVAAHWAYKTDYSDQNLDKQIVWVRQFLDSSKDDADPSEFMQSFKFDLFQDEIFVFTPKGQLIDLPSNATPVDFAFAVHTEVGLCCIGAKVNSKVVPLNTTLHNGDEVEVLTSSKPNPQEYWMSFVVTSKALGQIKKWFNENRKLQYEKLGKELLLKEFSQCDTDEDLFDENALKQRSGYSNLNVLYQALAKREISPTEIVKRVYPSLYKKSKISLFERIPRIWKRDLKQEPYINIHGEYPLVIELSKCCKPVPGEKIVGF
ncbi:RelA/SpoT family protein, partial [candidate division KSB1 bacterium]